MGAPEVSPLTYLIIALLGLSLGLPFVYPLESPNTGAVLGSSFGYLTGIIIDKSIGNPI